jgi:hypothetical protein
MLRGAASARVLFPCAAHRRKPPPADFSVANSPFPVIVGIPKRRYNL